MQPKNLEINEIIDSQSLWQSLHVAAQMSRGIVFYIKQ
jgi:hypothetical protein